MTVDTLEHEQDKYISERHLDELFTELAELELSDFVLAGDEYLLRHKVDRGTGE